MALRLFSNSRCSLRQAVVRACIVSLFCVRVFSREPTGQPEAKKAAGEAELGSVVVGPPQLSFRREPHRSHGHLNFVRATFPSLPGCTWEAWCYESDLEFLSYRQEKDGRLELRHRWRRQPELLVITTVIPQPGAAEFVARATADRERDATGHLPASLPALNLCFQLRQAEMFRSRPDPYPQFVRRCFIFTDKGRTFLLQTHRRRILHRFSANDPRNNPPWVQMYVGVWRPVPPVQGHGWAEYSTDRYTLPLIGTVSRDGKYLVAVANGSAGMLCNAWHDCLHNNPEWEPAGAPPAERRWRLKVYVMPNEPQRLLSRFRKDFPQAARLLDQRVPAQETESD